MTRKEKMKLADIIGSIALLVISGCFIYKFFQVSIFAGILTTAIVVFIGALINYAYHKNKRIEKKNKLKDKGKDI